MSDEQINVINERVALEDVKNQMARYQKVAEAYANATPEQRAQVDPALVQSVIDKYNEFVDNSNLKYERKEWLWNRFMSREVKQKSMEI